MTAPTASSRLYRTLLIAGACALFTVACSKNDDRTVGQKVDAAVNSAEQKKDEASSAIQKESDKLKETVEDAAITTSVKAALTQDPTLSALAISVNTTAGVVALHGSAPSVTARERATTLAMAVKGVSRVDNALDVKR